MLHPISGSIHVQLSCVQALEAGDSLYRKGIAAAAGASKNSPTAGLRPSEYERSFARAPRSEVVASLEVAQSTVRWDALRSVCRPSVPDLMH